MPDTQAELDQIKQERRDDLRVLLIALGLGDHARPKSPAEVFQECLAEIARLREAAK